MKEMRLVRDEVLKLTGCTPASDLLDAYQRLTDGHHSFASTFTPEEIFWSRYFWFRLFAYVTSATVGKDAGVEQQAFQLLEHPFPPCNPDWSRLESVDALAKREASKWPSKPPSVS